MKRPTPDASTNSWVDIWLACMDAKFRQAPSANAGDPHFDAAREAKRKVPRSLHQNCCGHGYRQADNVFLHPGVQFFNGPPCDLGCNPAEADGASRARAMKRIHG